MYSQISFIEFCLIFTTSGKFQRNIVVSNYVYLRTKFLYEFILKKIMKVDIN
jgi:hypothetical protein